MRLRTGATAAPRLAAALLAASAGGWLAGGGVAGAGLVSGAAAATLRAGPGQPFPSPSAAIAAAAPGDTVLIAPGEYFDCAVIGKDRLTIAGDGAGVVMTDRTCQGKAILVASGAGITVRDLTLARARVPDHNGAGIRAEGRDLTVERVRFVDNEDGLLAAEVPGSTIRITDSEFTGNGRCIGACAHGVYAGRIGLLRIENTRFTDTREGHHIKSRAERTELVGNDISDGPDGTASFLVELPDGGDLDMHDNRLEKGPKAADRRTAIMLGDESAGRSDARQDIMRNSFRNDTGASPAFVLNWGRASPAVADNVLAPGTVALSRQGLYLHRLHAGYDAAKAFVHDLAGFAKRVVRKLISFA